MVKKMKVYSAEFKSKVALTALQGEYSVNEITSKYGVHSTQINRWKQQALENIKAGFQGKLSGGERSNELLVNELYQEIGRQKIELEWLKKRV